MAEHVDHASLDPDRFDFLMAVDDGDSILIVAAEAGQLPAATAQADQLLATRRRLVATMGLAAWSPTPDGPSSPAWALIAVGVGGLSAFAGVRRIQEDQSWTYIPNHHLPWFALSTASALRMAIETGTSLHIKRATTAELYRRPDECPKPPLDERGRL